MFRLGKALRPLGLLSRGMLRPSSALRPAYSPQRLFATANRFQRPLTASAFRAPIRSYTAITREIPAAINTATAQKQATVTKTRPIVGYWLYFNAGLTFAIVIVGGLTRLTESGLSITEWNVIAGMKPPRSEEEWVQEFEKYKQYPEYHMQVPLIVRFIRLNRHMTLDEFKTIFYWEWSHRMIGRFIGAMIIVPGLYFAARGMMTRRVAKHVFGLASLIGFQGFIGWYMVKSGLDRALMEKPGAVPRVSQYRLTAHLCTAFLVYIWSVLLGADILRSAKIADGTYPKSTAVALNNPALRTFRRTAIGAACLIFATAMSGGVVAGLDAGLIYNEFPFMGGRIVPPTKELWSDDFVKPGDTGKWRNLLENPTAVQFDHRTMAEATATAITALWLYSRRLPLPKNARVAMNAMLGVTAIQVTLGITTLLYMVPINLAAAHQGGALTLLTTALWLVHAMRRVPIAL